ncbi:MAG: Wzz/FepE/Etk N-terminal domain-containing protein [Bacteroidota bacterium]
MNQHERSAPSDDGELDRIDLVDYVVILFSYRKILFYNALIVGLVSIVVSLLLPQWYRSTASIMPPKEQFSFSAVGGSASLLRNFSSLQRLGSSASQNGAYNYLAILASRTVKEAVVRAHDLAAVYEIADSSVERAIEALESHVAIETEDQDYITITVEDKDPRRAADIANTFVDLLNRRSLELGSLEAGRNREFIASRLEETREELRRAEDRLRKQQESSTVPFLPDAGGSGASAVAQLFAERARKEIELAILSRSTSPDNPLVRQLALEVEEIERKTRTLPETGMEGLRLYREVLIQQKILEVIIPLHEQAKVEEKKDVPVLIVLDRAVPAERKFKPKKAVIVTVSVAVSVLLTMVFLIMHEIMGRRKIYQRLRDEVASRLGRTRRE